MNSNTLIIRRLHRVILTLLFSVLLLPVQSTFAQFQPTPVQISSNQTEINGKLFYLHEVKPGHTLYSISKAYAISQESIVLENPILKEKPLGSGMVILIPMVIKKPDQEIKTIEEAYKLHVIQPRETWFSISRTYGTKVADLKENNPKYKWGLPAGDTLRIPFSLITENPSPEISDPAPDISAAIKDSPKDSLRSGNEINSAAKEPVFQPKGNRELRMAVLLPLHVGVMDTLTMADSVQNDYLRFWEFLQGVYLAVDSLRNQGYQIDLKVIDTERSPTKMESLIRTGQLNNLDLIIGPVYSDVLAVVARHARDKKIPLVSPLSTRADVLKGNPWVYQVNPSATTQQDLYLRYLADQADRHLVILAPDTERYSSGFGQMINKLKTLRIRKTGTADLDVLYYQQSERVFIKTDSTQGSLYAAFKAGKKNLAVALSSDEAFVTEMVNRLKALPDSYQISLFGMPQWMDFLNVDLQYLFDLNLEIYTNGPYPFVDYDDQHVRDFCRLFRIHWNNDPGQFAFQGFDITTYFGLSMLEGRKWFRSADDSLNSHDDFLQIPFGFSQVSEGDGFENRAITIIRYNAETLTRERIQVVRVSDN